MKKFSVFVAILLCLLGCQAKPTTEETLKAQAELFLQKVDTLPQLSAAVEDEKTSREEAAQLVEEWNKALVEHLKPVMTDQGITNFVANRMPTGFNRLLGISEEESTAEHRQVTSVEPLSGGDVDVTVTYTTEEKEVRLLLNFKETDEGWRIESLRIR
ncbi:hypothetical protein [Holdemania massiliensis]|uniref:DUF4878 domain-containing protein n=1 Tax=Holdemania massiliensis TaxID=1468449 RepID=A0A6N7S4H8_9FIRM|nr:hypothetical protein [Holdemania massiliensis]MSA69843.1 hypothetical protein [Holdemania massiliensis]MSA88689.1 hypothetical protein [Holdemania massiliensis]MSB77310.1 hypothetical protein [Holdemania massiliensis]MSC32236.1 hypothetical protein [Holdemania massiliensis]MSC38389.1 hypothetical protein [Holdemania massiliensis]